VLVLTEAGSKRRASLHLLADARALAAADPGGIDVLAADPTTFAAQLAGARTTRSSAALTSNPQLFSGIGNAYSDEILHAARLSPVLLTRALDDEQVTRLQSACAPPC
jgi:formamidopyrimidine-DNA glycosylase